MRIEKKATVVSTSVATLLVFIKLAVGIMSGSVAILASAIDSLLDMTVSIFNYYALHLSEKHPDDKFHFGRSKLEPLAAVIEGTIISMSALFILYEAIQKIINKEAMTMVNESIGVMIASIVITAFLVLFLRSIAKKTGNMVIKADALHYQTDLISNGAILVALGLVAYTGETIIDPILGIAIAAYMIYSAFPIIKEGILMLLDVAIPKEDIVKVEEIIENFKEVNGYHYLKTRQSGSHVFISVHVVFTPEMTLLEAHRIADSIENAIRKYFQNQNKKAHILIHMDPYDDYDVNLEEDYF